MEQAVDGVGGECHTLAALPLGKRPGTNCTGGWVGPGASLDRCRKSRPPPPPRLGFSPKTQACSELLYRLHLRDCVSGMDAKNS